MYAYRDIRHLHLEISSECNAACPLCPRNFYGYPMNFGYTEHSMTLAEAKKIFEPGFISRLTEIVINGNFGDIVMCPEAIDIIRYFRAHNDTAKISISTNGGARDKKFWKDLADARCQVFFCIDGLENTHSIYRKNTLYSTVISNAQTFISAQGYAIWKMIKFEHNEHQIEACRTLSKKLGFRQFDLQNHGRNVGPVFDKSKKLVFYIGKKNETTNFDLMLENLQAPPDDRFDESLSTQNQGIKCYAKNMNSVYVSSTGEAYPCCWTGFSPQTYGQGLKWWDRSNGQIAELIVDNDAKTHGLEKAIEWFSAIESSWDKATPKDGLIEICNRQPMCKARRESEG